MQVTDVLNDKELTFDEMTNKLHEIAGGEKTDKREELIQKSKEQAKENRIKVAQINYDSSIKEKMEILAFLKNSTGDNQFDKDYLSELTGYQLESIYNECLETMPDAMMMASEDRAKAKDNGEIIFEDYNLGDAKETSTMETEQEQVPEQESVSRLKEISDKIGTDVDSLTNVANHRRGVIEQQGETILNDTEPEKKTINNKKTSGSKLMKALDSKAARAALIAGAGIAALTLLIINAPVALGAAAVALVGNEINKGRKGR